MMSFRAFLMKTLNELAMSALKCETYQGAINEIINENVKYKVYRVDLFIFFVVFSFGFSSF